MYKPYSYRIKDTSKWYRSEYDIKYEGGLILNANSLPAIDVQRIVDMLNGAYHEGYMACGLVNGVEAKEIMEQLRNRC